MVYGCLCARPFSLRNEQLFPHNIVLSFRVQQQGHLCYEAKGLGRVPDHCRALQCAPLPSRPILFACFSISVLSLHVLHFLFCSSLLRPKPENADRFFDLADAVAAYEVTCKETSTGVDSALLDKMKAVNEARLKEIDEAIKDALENEGDLEVRDATIAKAQILARTADKATAISGYEEAEQ